MYSIYNYMQNNTPAAAKAANSLSTRNMIRGDAREHAAYLNRVKCMALEMGQQDWAKSVNEEICFICKWLIAFGVADE